MNHVSAKLRAHICTHLRGAYVLCALLIVALSVLFSGCGGSHLYDKQAAVLDSVKIVLQVKLSEIKKTETNIQVRGFSKYQCYKRFLEASLRDTISRSEAAALQQFLSSGEIMEQYNLSKTGLMDQTALSVAQLQKLVADLRENNLGATQVQQFYFTEKEHAEKLVQVIEKNITAANIGLMNFKNSTPRVEELIRQINNGRLPEVVADSIPH